jgi:hypothetical protein
MKECFAPISLPGRATWLLIHIHFLPVGAWDKWGRADVVSIVGSEMAWVWTFRPRSFGTLHHMHLWDGKICHWSILSGKSRTFLFRVVGVRQSTTGPLYQFRMTDGYEAFGGVRIGKGNPSTRRKSTPMPQTPYLLKNMPIFIQL